MSRKHHILALILIGLVAASLLVYNYMRLDGILFNPVVTYYDDGSVPTTQKTYIPKQTVQGITSFCKNRDVKVEAYYFLVDTYMKSYPVKEVNVPKGCYFDKVYDMAQIPPDAYTGYYHLEVRYYARLNPINTVEWTRKSADFMVVR